MKIRNSYINWDRLEKLDDEKVQVLFIQLSMVLTEINIFRKLIQSCDEQKPQNEFLEGGRLQIRYSLLFVTCAKIFEGWKLIDLRHKDIRTGDNKESFYREKNWLAYNREKYLNPFCIKLLEELREYFEGGDSLIENIRNRYANHYKTSEMKKVLKGKNFREIGFFGVENNPYNFFSQAATVFTFGLLDEISPGARRCLFQNFGKT